jgi:rubrerythrin
LQDIEEEEHFMDTTGTDTRIIAQLNDLLRLDHDAVLAYTLAIKSLKNEDFKTTLRGFRGDHERHIEELSHLIEARDGMPIPLPHESGIFKLAVQGVASLGSDVTILRTFRSNERQVRDKYERVSKELSGEDAVTADILSRAAADERRHFEWVDATLRRLGHDPGSTEEAFGRVHERAADAMEAGERLGMRGVEGARRTWRRSPALIAAGAAALVGGAALLTRALRNR